MDCLKAMAAQRKTPISRIWGRIDSSCVIHCDPNEPPLNIIFADQSRRRPSESFCDWYDREIASLTMRRTTNSKKIEELRASPNRRFYADFGTRPDAYDSARQLRALSVYDVEQRTKYSCIIHRSEISCDFGEFVDKADNAFNNNRFTLKWENSENVRISFEIDIPIGNENTIPFSFICARSQSDSDQMPLHRAALLRMIQRYETIGSCLDIAIASAEFVRNLQRERDCAQQKEDLAAPIAKKI